MYPSFLHSVSILWQAGFPRAATAVWFCAALFAWAGAICALTEIPAIAPTMKVPDIKIRAAVRIRVLQLEVTASEYESTLYRWLVSQRLSLAIFIWRIGSRIPDPGNR